MQRVTWLWESLNPDTLWYVVGLIATDGCLSVDGRHIDITAKDGKFLRQLIQQLGLKIKVAQKQNGRGQSSYRIQIGSVSFYRFLVSLGLTPRKSKTLSFLKIPPQFFAAFFRGVIDGDGSLRSWIHSSNGRKQWSLRISSGSKAFLEWLQKTVQDTFGVSGEIHKSQYGEFTVYVLKYGKMAMIEICHHCYLSETATIFLERKYRLAKTCVSSRKSWSRSKTTQLARVVESVDTRDSSQWVSLMVT